MAFASLNKLEATIVKHLYELADDPKETQAKMAFQNHPLLDDEEYYVAILEKKAIVEDLREHMSETPRFKMHSWYPHEPRLFWGSACLCG